MYVLGQEKNKIIFFPDTPFLCLFVLFVFLLFYYFFFFFSLGLWYRIVGDIMICLAAHYLCCLYSSGRYSMKNIFLCIYSEWGAALPPRGARRLRGRSHGTGSLTSSVSHHVMKRLAVGRHAVCFLRNAVKRKLICWWRLLGACFMFKSPGMVF